MKFTWLILIALAGCSSHDQAARSEARQDFRELVAIVATQIDTAKAHDAARLADSLEANLKANRQHLADVTSPAEGLIGSLKIFSALHRHYQFTSVAMPCSGPMTNVMVMLIPSSQDAIAAVAMIEATNQPAALDLRLDSEIFATRTYLTACVERIEASSARILAALP